jgi:ribose 5-phosphate isomerase
MSEKITIHRALSELKTLDSRIEKAISEIVPSAIHQKDKPINGHLPIEEFKTRTVAQFNSATDLIKRKTLIKSKIVESNSKTRIKIGDKTMTVSDAITEKLNVEIKRKMIAVVKMKYQGTLNMLNDNNKKVEENCQAVLMATFGKDNTKATESDIKNVRLPFIELHTFHLCDPLKIDDKLKKMEFELAEFETEIDATLSESNAITTIEI